MKINRIIYASLLCLTLNLTGCYIDSTIKDQLEELENRIDRLEADCQKINMDISALKEIIDAIEKREHITDIKPILEGKDIVGYVISFSQRGDIKIYNGKDGKPGIDGYTPTIGVKADNDGKFYWTIDGKFLTDSNGNKVPANGTSGKDGITPKLKIIEGYWYVSYDGGLNWEPEPLGPVSGVHGAPTFSNVTYDENFVYFTLADGNTTLKVPRYPEGQSQPSLSVTANCVETTSNTASFSGHLNAPASDMRFSKVTLYYSESPSFNIYNANNISTSVFDSEQNFTLCINDLKAETVYYYCLVAKVKNEESYSETASFKTKATMPQWNAGTYFAMGVTKDSGWYDVNKRKNSSGYWDGCYLHCWAIAASNMLQWWQDIYKKSGKILPANTPDGSGSLYELAIYENMKNSFEDAGGSTQVGVHWFFTGEDREANMQGANHPKPYTGGFYKNCFTPIMNAMGGNDYCKNTNGYSIWGVDKNDPRSSLTIVSEYLRNAISNGMAALTVRVGRSLLHEITLWGIDLDSNGNVTHVWITDSDDQMNLHYSKPRTPVLHHLAVREDGYFVRIQGYYNGDSPAIMAITTLTAYPESKKL